MINIKSLKLILLVLVLTTTLTNDDEKCNKYNNKFMTLLHQSLELECKKNTKNHKKCKQLLSKIQYYNKLRTKHCYK